MEYYLAAVLIFTKTGAGGTDKVWFYDLKADRGRTEQSFLVPKEELVENAYDLSINKYKKIEYVAVEYLPTSEIMTGIKVIQKKITEEIDELERML